MFVLKLYMCISDNPSGMSHSTLTNLFRLSVPLYDMCATKLPFCHLLCLRMTASPFPMVVPIRHFLFHIILYFSYLSICLVGLCLERNVIAMYVCRSPIYVSYDPVCVYIADRYRNMFEINHVLRQHSNVFLTF